jgi:hypothetical protein
MSARSIGTTCARTGRISGLIFGSRAPCLASRSKTRAIVLLALSIDSCSPEAFAYSASAMTLNSSVRTYLLFRSGLPSLVTRKNILPSLSKPWRLMNSTPCFARCSHSSLFSRTLYSLANNHVSLPTIHRYLSPPSSEPSLSMSDKNPPCSASTEQFFQNWIVFFTRSR